MVAPRGFRANHSGYVTEEILRSRGTSLLSEDTSAFLFFSLRLSRFDGKRSTYWTLSDIIQRREYREKIDI